MATAIVLALTSTGLHADVDPLEEILVTGSRIARPDFESASPIVSVPQGAFRESSPVSVERTLAKLPQFVPAAGSTSNEPANDGQANLSLRGVGVGQTLVLVDGRRLVPADGDGSVDLNVLPPTLIERVEVVTGGASAVYGSDAIAGVVNVHLLDRFDGVEVHGEWTQTSRGDGREYSAGLLAGTPFAGERGDIVAYLGYAERDMVTQGARQFSKYPYRYYENVTYGYGPGGAFLGWGEGISDAGFAVVFPSPTAFTQVFTKYGYAPGTVPYSPVVGVNNDDDRTLFSFGNGTPGGVVNYGGDVDPHLYNDRTLITYNTAPNTALQLPLERTSALLRGRFEMTDAAEAYLQALYSQYSTTRQLPPPTSGIVLVPPTNPFIPPDLRTLLASRAAPDQPFRFQTRATLLGPRTAQNDRDLVQVTVGVRGDVFADWHYDAYVQRGRNERSEQQDRVTRRSKYEELLFAPDGGVSACGGLDVFGRGRITAECAAYVVTSASNDSQTDQSIAEVTFRGPLFALNTGPVQGAVGVFHKRDEFEYVPDPQLTVFLPEVPDVIGERSDVFGLGVGAARRGSETNTDLYVETLIPVLRDATAGRALDIGLGYRRSDYERAGTADSYKVEMTFRPRRPLLLRGSLQHAVRAPSVDELYWPELSGSFFVQRPDPCAYFSAARTGPDRAQVEALCVAQGLRPELMPGYDFQLQFVDGVQGGNVELDPEEADSYTVGIALEFPTDRPLLGNLQIALDAYRIDFRNGIGRWPTETALTRCFDPAFNSGYDPAYPYCAYFRRVPETGEPFALELERNIGGVDTSGVDLQIDWGADAGAGRLGANALVNYVADWEATEPDGRRVSYVDTIGYRGLGGAIPRWRSLLAFRYQWSDVTAYVRWQHIDAMRDARFREFEVPARDYVDIGASMDFTGGALHGLGVTLGIENVTDAEPPLFPSYTQANTDPSQYDVLGRRFFVSLRYRL